MATFRDHFSGHAADYRAFRPEYPAGLFEFLAQRAPSRALAWDAATGSGQAAVALADHFDRVVATDASAEQIRNATPHPRVEYSVSQTCPAAGVDLVTVCQALHWFDLEPFFAEVGRVLKPGGLFAAVGYRGHRVNPAVDAVLDRFENLIGPYWPPERQLVEERYRTIPFPFTEIEVPPFTMSVDWDAATHLGYLRTWSAVKQFIHARGFDPLFPLSPASGERGRGEGVEVPLTAFKSLAGPTPLTPTPLPRSGGEGTEGFEVEFAAAWGDAVRTVRWELIVRVGS